MKRKILFLGLLFAFLILIINIVNNRFIPTTPYNKDYTYPSSFMIKDNNNFFDYQPGYECSAFSSSYVLRHYGYNDTGLKLYENFPNKLSDGGGVYPQGIISMFQSRGFDAEMMTNGSIDDLKQEISKGAPVIVYIHVDVDADSVHYTHYVPLIGYDEEAFYFAESLPYKANYIDKGLSYNRKTDIETFKQLWTNVEGMYENPYFRINKK